LTRSFGSLSALAHYRPSTNTSQTQFIIGKIIYFPLRAETSEGDRGGGITMLYQSIIHSSLTVFPNFRSAIPSAAGTAVVIPMTGTA
tara:strand:+ start:672 stop:932 length:261 start_codon:yes stop_codon:yes gene_type:complete